jgi:predicted TIM-barrel fold metal-dependent hydrolase
MCWPGSSDPTGIAAANGQQVARVMSQTRLQAIDCDIHPSVPSMRALLPYLDDYWRETVEARGIASLESISYPRHAPLTARPDWRVESGQAATDLAAVRTQLLDHFDVRLAVCNCLYGVQLVFDAYMAKAFASALNDWTAREWLDPEPRLRASIVVPLQDPEFAIEEIERCAPDRRFVQVLILAMGELPLGRRAYWPVYAAALRHALPIGIHAGSSYRHPVTSVGWPTTYAEDYASQAQGFQAQLTSLITEGVFRQFPDLKVVLLESGVTWLPAYLWRLGKFWRGLRFEIPWVDRPPHEVVRDQVRLTIQPLDAPAEAGVVSRIVEHLRSDAMLLFATDYPHWQFEGDAVLPDGLPDDLIEKIAVANPLETYPRLRETA